METKPFSLVYIERKPSAGDGSTGDTISGVLSGRSSAASARGMTVLKTPGLGIMAITPDKLDKKKLASFRDLLHTHGIATGTWGINGAKSVEHLFWEAYEQRGCLITGINESGGLKRVTRLVKVKLISEIFGVDHALVSRMQFMHDGQSIERRQVPLKKLNWVGYPEADAAHCSDSFYAEECRYTEPWRHGCKQVLSDRLGLSERWQEQHLREETVAYSYHTEDNVKSNGYPGLNTLYCIHEVTFRVIDPETAQCIGLPQGQEFATTEGDFNFNGQHDEDGLPIGTQLNIWMWARENAVERKLSGPHVATASHVMSFKSDKEPEPMLIKRVPLPELSAHALNCMHTRLASATRPRPPRAALWACMEGEKTDWAKAKKIAKSIADPKYTLSQFNKDLSAFPELNLYLLEQERLGDRSAFSAGSGRSGRTIGDEYQRTVGAFFAIYWLMRLKVDGKEGFSFGVDEKWRPVKPSSHPDMAGDKRHNFYKHGSWQHFKRLFVEAGLLEETKWTLKVNQKRMVSLLALTAVHDIMKIEMLNPEVQEAHAPFHGYKAGDIIADHDLALAYVMDHYPELLPSFRDLDPEERRAVQFTQCNLCFNHGWFVQAEAPPGAVFTKFRECLIRDHKSQIASRDVALYFVHWLTDLAGAEPTPLGGCEKFATKFPLPVLNSFLRSFEFVEKITTRTETEVMEEYLQMRWREHEPSVGELPTGDSAIARMRLLCMAQMNATRVLKDFQDLPEEDQEVLSVEMARSGCVGQSYSAELIPNQVHAHPAGPAFLIYYGPAFFQNLGTERALLKLSALAEVYRCARVLWPASIAKVASNVIVRIDTIKNLSFSDLREVMGKGDMWVLIKHNDNEAFIERSSKKKLNKFISNGQSVQVLDFSFLQNKSVLPV